MIDFKSLPKNKKAVLITAAAVLVTLVILLVILVIVKGNEPTEESPVSSGDHQIVINPAGLDDNQSVAGLDAETTVPSGSTDTDVMGTTSSEHGNYTGPSASWVEDGIKTPPKTTTAPPDKIVSGTKPTEKPKKDTVTPGTVNSKEDYTPEDGTPHYGVTDETYPESNTPGVEGEEKPVDGFIDNNGRPGEGIHF